MKHLSQGHHELPAEMHKIETIIESYSKPSPASVKEIDRKLIQCRNAVELKISTE